MTRATANSLTLVELSSLVGGQFSGPPDLPISGIASLVDARSTDVSFYASRRYSAALKTSKAGAVLVPIGTPLDLEKPYVWVDNPHAAFALVAAKLHPKQPCVSYLDPKAHIDPSASIDPTACVEAFAWIGPDVVIGPRTHIEAHVRIGKGAGIGQDCHLMAGSVVRDGCQLKNGVVLHPNAVIGADGFGFSMTASGPLKAPQIGGVMLCDNVEIGANSCVDRGALADTIVNKGVKTDNFVQIGHGAQVGEMGLLVAYSGIAGSTEVGERLKLGARATVLGHLKLGDDVSVASCSMVHKNLPANAQVAGIPAIDRKDWQQAAAAFKRLPQLRQQLRNLVGFMDIDAEPRAILPHREPFILIDRLIELIPGQRGTAIKCLSLNESWAAGHFPGNPIYPGALMLESMAQLAGAVAVGRPLEDSESVMLVSINKAKFRQVARPGDRLSISATLLREKFGISFFSCVVQDGERRISEAEVGIAKTNEGL